MERIAEEMGCTWWGLGISPKVIVLAIHNPSWRVQSFKPVSRPIIPTRTTKGIMRMRALVLLFCLLIPTLAVASPITCDFTGNLGNPNMVWLVVVILIVVVPLVHWSARGRR